MTKQLVVVKHGGVNGVCVVIDQAELYVLVTVVVLVHSHKYLPATQRDGQRNGSSGRTSTLFHRALDPAAPIKSLHV